MASQLFSTFLRATDANANPLPAATLTFYNTGGAVLRTVYQDSAMGTPHANPVVADAGGAFPPIYLDGAYVYRAILKNAAGTTVPNGDVDPINVVDPSLFQQSGAGASARTSQDKLREWVSIDDYGGNGDGATDNAAAFAACAAAGAGVITLPEDKTYYIASTITISAKVISLGGKLKRHANAVVTLAGGFEGSLDQNCFIISNITPTQGILIDGDGTHEWSLGTGSFKIEGKAYLRWFMETTVGDQSKAILALAETDAAEQWLSTPATFSYGVLGHSPIFDAKFTMVTGTTSFSVDAADAMVNAFGEEREFYFRPKSGMARLHCRFTPNGEIDGNASTSWDVANNFVFMKSNGRQAFYTCSSVNCLSTGQSAMPLAFTAGATAYTVGEIVRQAATGAYGEVVTKSATGLTVRMATNANFTAATAVVGDASGTSIVPTGFTPYYRQPRYIQIDNLFAHNVIRNCYIGNGGEAEQILNNPHIGNSYLDHWIYVDNCRRLLINNPMVFGYARGGGIQVSVGIIDNLMIDPERLLVANPITALRTKTLVQCRGDLDLSVTIIMAVSGDFTPLSPQGAERNLIFSSGAGSVHIRGWVEDLGPADNVWNLYGQSSSTQPVTMSQVQVRNAARGRIVFIEPKDGGILRQLQINGMEWTVRAGTTAEEGALIQSGVGTSLHNCRINGLTINGTAGTGYKSLFLAPAGTDFVHVRDLYAATLTNTRPVLDYGYSLLTMTSAVDYALYESVTQTTSGATGRILGIGLATLTIGNTIPFIDHESVTQATTGATGFIVSKDNSTLQLFIQPTSGTFTTGNIITGTATGATDTPTVVSISQIMYVARSSGTFTTTAGHTVIGATSGASQVPTVVSTSALSQSYIANSQASSVAPTAVDHNSIVFENYGHSSTMAAFTDATYLARQNFAVASLPAVATVPINATTHVTDANATTPGGVVAAGGANRIPVTSDGTNWRIG